MKRITRYICLALSLSLILSLLVGCSGAEVTRWQPEQIVDFTTGFSLASEEKNELKKVHETDNLALYVNFNRGEVAVEDKRTGCTWYSNPADHSEDGLASGFHKNALQSTITMVYTTDLSVDMTCGGFMSSVRKDSLYYRIENDGSVLFYFDFPNEKISVPVRYSITDDCFIAEIIAHGIREYGTNTIKSIDLLPFFGAGGSKDDGYLFLPDGSGALVYFNNNRLTANTYSKTLYGFDNGTNDKVMGGKASAAYFTLSENQQLPVFGISNGDQGFLAIINEGAARAGINANVAYKYTMYNAVWPTYYYHSIGTVRQTQKDGSETVTKVTEKNTEVWQNFQVSYYFLEEGKNTYSDMAQLYRDYLIANAGLQERLSQSQSLPLYLDLYGYIKKTKSFLGIPVESKIPTTTIDDVNAMLDQLEGSDIRNVVVKYNYWANNSYFDKIPTTTAVDGTIGSAKQMQQLQQRLQQSGGDLYLSADLLNIYKTGRGISQYGGVLRNVANTNQRQYEFSLSSASIDSRYAAWYLLRPDRIPSVFSEYADDMVSAGYPHLALDNAGSMLYSELSSGGIGRNQVLQMMAQTLQTVEGKTQGLMLSAANDYAAVLATHIINAPSKSSNYDLEDVSVPFYQMVFHGYVSYSLDPSNLSSNPTDTTLKLLEYGASPIFSLIGSNADELIGSRMDELYSADAADWMDFIAAQYGQLSQALAPVLTSTITSHQILSEYVRAVTYSNGTVIYINYATTEQTADGITLQPKGFAVIADGQEQMNAQAVGR